MPAISALADIFRTVNEWDRALAARIFAAQVGAFLPAHEEMADPQKVYEQDPPVVSGGGAKCYDLKPRKPPFTTGGRL
jgi:hypothetical protein